MARIATSQAHRARELEARIDLARDIHDGAIQRLFGVSLALAGEGDLDAAARARAAEELQAALAGPARRRPAAAEPRRAADRHDARGRDRALRRRAPRRSASRSPTAIRADVPPELEALAQSVLVEAIRNAQKHADPHRVAVRVGREDVAFVLDGRQRRRARGRRERRGWGCGSRRSRRCSTAASSSSGAASRAPGRCGWWSPLGPDARDGPRSLRVLIVDDHDVVHWGFRLMLGQQAWVERTLSARTGAEAIALAERYEPHVALVDLFVGEESGPEIAERLRALAIAPKILLISGAGRISQSAARAAGAAGFVQKDWPAADVANAVQMVGRGHARSSRRRRRPAGPGLTEREREVLELIASGATNREIAGALHLSPHTVKEHTSSLYRKLEVRNRAEAVQRAQRLGLLS